MVKQFEACKTENFQNHAESKVRVERALKRLSEVELGGRVEPERMRETWDISFGMDTMRRVGPGRPRKVPIAPPHASMSTEHSASAEAEFVRDVLIAGGEWLEVMATVVTPESASQMIIRAAALVLRSPEAQVNAQ